MRFGMRFGHGSASALLTLSVLTGLGSVLCGQAALATDYYQEQTAGGKSASVHTTFINQDSVVRVNTCAGNAGCCCTDNVSGCPATSGTQSCGSGANICDVCCQHGGVAQDDGLIHSTCCADPGGCCDMGPACGTPLTAACLVYSGNTCASATANLCGPAGANCGQPLSRDLSVGDLLDLGIDDALALHDGTLLIRFEFMDAAVLEFPVNPIPLTGKEPPAIPALSSVALLTMVGVLMAIGLAVLLARRYGARAA